MVITSDPRPKEPTASPRKPKSNRWLGVYSTIIVLWIGAFVLPFYITLDPDRAQIPLSPDVPFHYPFLVVHIAGGIIAMLTGCLQMWPRLRAKPHIHRRIGRIYVFGGVVPSSLATTVLIAVRMSETRDYLASIVVGNIMWDVMWLATTVAAYRAARSRDYIRHRRLMIYSFALTTAIMWTRPLFLSTLFIPGFRLNWFTENTGWVFWTLHLIIAQMYLNKTDDRKRRRRAVAT